ncbi:MAG TPA: cobalamin-dependent protein [Fibrobacteria bacterium]|jgi:excisionase family DNA binding protein|nr:cobalamin-dependent protein [Fibrobacteria bacterium]
MDEKDSEYLTTSQAAVLLGVHESSVKRWSNAGELAIEKTSGGHRRIRLEALLSLAHLRAGGSDSFDLLAFAPHDEEVARAALDAREHGDFDALRELILRFCDTRPPVWLSRLLAYLQSPLGLPLSRIFDAGVAAALADVGREWQVGARTIALEHRFSQKILDALHAVLIGHAASLGDALVDDERPRAVLGCAEGCHHEIGGLMARIMLERAGWNVTYLGANVPYEEIAGIQELERSQLVCVSFAPPLGASDARRCLKVLNALRRPEAPYRMVIGGLPRIEGGVETHESELPISFFSSMESFERWLRGAAWNPT